jgi:hypothetical protein
MIGGIVRGNGFALDGGGSNLWRRCWLLCSLLGPWRKVRVVAEGEWLEILLLLDSYDHLFKIVWGDVSFPTTTTAVDRVLSLDLGM